MNEYGCNVCSEEYSAHNESKYPRVLSGCGHTICQRCVTSICGSDRHAILCPFDRVSTVIPGGDINNLKKNYALLELLEKLSDVGYLERCNNVESADRFVKERKMNVKCDEDDCHTAVLYCTVCESNLCERCSEITHAANVLSKHKRVPLSEKPPTNVYCKIHSKYVVEFVCKEELCDYESPLMCLMCRDYGCHKDHKCVMLESEANSLKETFRVRLVNLTKQNEVINKSLADINKTIHKLSPECEDGNLVESRQEVRAHFRQLRTALERDEESAISKLESHARERVEGLSKQADRLKSLSEKIEEACKELEKALQFDRGPLFEQKDDILAFSESVCTDKTSLPDSAQLNPKIAFSISNDRKLHIGDFIDSRIVLLGLDGSGKTSMVRRIKKAPMESILAAQPTIGFNVETIHYKNYRLNLWDVGGLPKIRHLWKHYYSNAQAILYVIDGQNPERFPEATKELMKVISDPLVGNCPVIVAINRKDGSSFNFHLDALLSQLSALSYQVQLHQCDVESGSGIDHIIDLVTNLLTRMSGDCPM